MARKPVSHARAPKEPTSGSGSIIPRLIVVITFIAAIGAMIYRLRGPEMSGASGPLPPGESAPLETPAPGEADDPPDAGEQGPEPTLASEAPAEPTEPAPTDDASDAVPLIGIVSGHWGNDTGAVCDDGLQEVDVNLEIAVRLVQILKTLGYDVDLLQERDARLSGYSADVLVSVHSDSCEPFPNADPPMSGFKVASVEDSWVADEEQRLIDCLAHYYGARTGLPYHASTVTHNMTRYHTFYEINGYTPAAIIETGFMAADRDLLTGQPDLVAQAIADGIVCFLTGEDTF